MRVVLPLALAVAGAALWIVSGNEDTERFGASLISAAVVIVAANLFVRLAFASQADRDREAQARERRAEELDREHRGR